MLLFIQQIITMNDSSRRDAMMATGGVIIMINWTADVAPNIIIQIKATQSC